MWWISVTWNITSTTTLWREALNVYKERIIIWKTFLIISEFYTCIFTVVIWSCGTLSSPLLEFKLLWSNSWKLVSEKEERQKYRKKSRKRKKTSKIKQFHGYFCFHLRHQNIQLVKELDWSKGLELLKSLFFYQNCYSPPPKMNIW